MMTFENPNDQEILDAIAFVGDALAPFFLKDPQTGSAASAFDAFSSLELDGASSEWPFGDDDLVASGLESMIAGLSDGITDSIVWEHRRLFVGPGHKAAPPWGSVYTDHDGVIFGESALELREWMRANGIQRHTSESEPDDHIGLMLGLMAWLAQNRPSLLDEYLRLHLLTWSSHYLAKLENEARHPFYKGLAVLTRTSLEGITAVRGVEVVYPRFYR